MRQMSESKNTSETIRPYSAFRDHSSRPEIQRCDDDSPDYWRKLSEKLQKPQTWDKIMGPKYSITRLSPESAQIDKLNLYTHIQRLPEDNHNNPEPSRFIIQEIFIKLTNIKIQLLDVINLVEEL